MRAYIEDDLRDIVAKVNTIVLPKLQAVRPEIEQVSYSFGTIDELNENLIQQGKTEDGKLIKYPLVFLLVDIKEPVGNVGDFADLKLRLAIINQTSKTFKARQRLDNNFKPIIMPIYFELLNQISLAGDIFIGASTPDNIKHTAIRRYYWGRESSGGNTANKLTDYVDGLEIDNLELRYYLNRC